MGAHSNCLKLSALLFAFFFLKAVQGSYLWGKLNWTQQSEDLTEKLIAEISQEDNGHSVTHILRSPSYNPSWTEQQDAKKHILGIIQMGNHRMIEPEKSGWEKQKMMKEDFNSLKHFSRGFSKLPQRLGDLFKDEDSKYDLCYGNFYRLKEIHTTMENLLPAFQVENSIIPNYKEIEDIFTRLLQELLGTVVQMSPTIKSESLHSRFLYLQRTMFETIYYFFKYQLIGVHEFVTLFRKHNTIFEFSKLVFQSYRHQQHLISSEILPQSRKNVLDNWYYSSFKFFLEGIGERDRHLFSHEYAKNSFLYYMKLPEGEKSQGLKMKISHIIEMTFGVDHQGKEGKILPDPTSREWSILYFKNNNFEELIDAFINIDAFEEQGKSSLELTLLFQLIEYLKEYYPQETQEILKGKNEFHKKFNLISSSTQLLSKLENIQIYLEREFKKPSWNVPIFSKKDKEATEKRLFELESFAKYIKSMEAEKYQDNEKIDYHSSLYRYCHYGIISDRIESLKLKLIELSEYYEKI